MLADSSSFSLFVSQTLGVVWFTALVFVVAYVIGSTWPLPSVVKSIKDRLKGK